ncbi:hypothetical protein Rleg5DRAFT_6245 [Rhizobium leguminosarum bv. viciae WSM1455]|nr:hypothetical protein Rleg5DRAFT_6245 [Rhizobium leguminosarum bv. viciae WSM1455]
MFWATGALQSDNPERAKKFLAYPPQAATPDIGSKYAVYKWDLETLITLALNTPKTNLPQFLMQPIDTRQFNSVAELVNALRAVEEDDTETRLNTDNILLEMHRVSHRQFAWQRGWARSADIYRYLYIYGQGACAEYFETTYGVSISDFFGVAFGVFAILRNGLWTGRITGMELLGIGEDAVTKTYGLLSTEIWTTRRESLKLLQKFENSLNITLPVVYQPSFLRVKPLIRSSGLQDKYIAPLPDLIMLRATLGLYYDLAPGGTTIMNDATARFEEYARKSIKALLPALDPAPAEQYTFKRNKVDTPDILLKKDGLVVAVFECKATKLTFEAQYGEDPILDGKAGYEQITKAVFQLWKFFSHVRRGILNINLAGDASAIVLTMEPWTQMSGDLRRRIIDGAHAMAADKDPEIVEEDKRKPLFCPIQDLDELLMTSTEDELLETFRTAIEDKYTGWAVRSIRSRVAPEAARKDAPFSLGDLLPWWNTVDKEKEKRRTAKK